MANLPKGSAGSEKCTTTTNHGRRSHMGLVVVLLFFYVGAFSQSYYTIEYQVPAGNGTSANIYYSFLTIWGDGTADARIRKPGNSTLQEVLVEIKLRDSLPANKRIPQNNKERWLVPAGTPEWLQGSADTSWKMPVFIFTDTLEVYELQTAYFQSTDTALYPCVKVVIASFSAAQLSADLVSRFFYPDEPFAQWITQPGFRELPANLRNARFHLVAMAHTTDPKIGASSIRDLQSIVSFFKNLTSQLGIALVLHTIEGAAFGKPALDAALQKVQPSTNDVVVFYYSGHGFRYAQDAPVWPRLSLRTGRQQALVEHQVDIAATIELLRAKGARTTLILTDCCNENIGALSPQGREWLRTRTLGFQRQHLNFGNCIRLFFPDKPTVIVAASADRYQLASGNPTFGGFFSYFLHMQLTRHLYTPIKSGGWLPLLAEARRQTRGQALTALCTGGPNGRCVQTPVFQLQ